MHRTDAPPREAVLHELSDWLQKTKGVTMLGALGFENAYALAMPRQKADALGINSIADLAVHSAQLSIAGDYEFFERPEWQALRAAYGLNFARQRTMQSDFMYQAAANGDVDVVSAYTSDGRIARYDLKVLADPKRAIPPYDAVLLIAPKRAGDAKLIDALKPLIGAIDVTAMREANLRASAGDTTPGAVARRMWGEIEKR
jgi:osmoprotectant transport system permease protein